MLEAIIGWSLRNRLIVIVATLVLVGFGVYAMLRLPIDAFPDTTPVMVQINTVASALTPEEIEQQVTLPLERVVTGLPNLQEVRSVSKFGFCQLTVIFDDDMDLYLARQLVNERVQTAELPDGVGVPELGPISTGLGEVLHYLVTSETRSLNELTTLQDWVIRPQLQTVPGVAEINTWGGERRQFQVFVDPMRLIKHDLTLDRVLEALRGNNMNVGGGNLTQAGELLLVHGVALTTELPQIENIVIDAQAGVPIRVRDVAEVKIGHEIRRGAVTANGKGEVVHGLGFMIMHENAHRVTTALRHRLTEVQKVLPDDVKLELVYDRTELVEKVIETVKKNLLEGGLLVVAILFIFLGNVRAGLIVALAIPLSMLFAFSMMLKFGIAASLLSLGALDFGLVVDSSVILVENSVRKLNQEKGKRRVIDVVRDAACEVRRPTMFGELIIMVVYLPILLLEGVEGKMFRPMALTVIFALTCSLILSLTLMPVLTSLLIRPKKHSEDGVLMRMLQSLYRPFLRFALRAPLVVIALAAGVLGGGAALATRLGGEFVPKLSEMAITSNAIRLAGISLDESVRYNTRIERTILEAFPDEIRDVWSRTGTAQVATDPMGLEVTDIFMTLNPRSEWKHAATQAELTEKINALLEPMPGQNLVFSQPIEMRMNEMIGGIRADLGVKIFGDDLDMLSDLASQVRRVVENIPGAADVSVEQLTGLPILQIRVDQDAIARFGLPARHVLEVVESIGGIDVGQIRQGDQRFELVVRLNEEYAGDASRLKRVLLPTPGGEVIPLERLADVRQIEGPATINRERQKRRIVVQANVRGSDLATFVQQARREIAANVEMPEGYFVDYGGQFENLIRASKRLTIIIPIALAIVLFLLWMSSGSWLDAAIVFTGAPMAAFGGIIALWLRDMPFTVSAAVGFIAVSGVSVLNGLVLMSTIRQREAEGLAPADAIESARLERMRPILMTALVAAIGFVPMALNTGVGAEVQRPLATVVIGGVISDSVLTLLVLPALVILTSRARKAALPDSTFEIPSSSEDVLRGPAANVSTDGA